MGDFKNIEFKNVVSVKKVSGQRPDAYVFWPSVVNVSEVLDILTKKAAACCEHYLSDLFMSWKSFCDILDTTFDIGKRRVYFGIRENGVDGYSLIAARLGDPLAYGLRPYRAILYIDITTMGRNITVELFEIHDEKYINLRENTRFTFQYRDACNYKKQNVAVLSGRLTEEEKKEVFDCLEGGEYFIPEQVGLDVERFGSVTEDDHCWCEVFMRIEDTFEDTNELPTADMTAQELVQKFREAKGKWDEARYTMEMREEFFAECFFGD